MIAVPVFAAWLAVTSPHFELVTDAGAKLARQLLGDLERVRVALAPVAGTPLPVRVVVFKRPEEFASYRPTQIAGAFFQSGPDRDAIVASVDADGRFPLQALIHEYGHLVLHHTTPVLPKWLDEGIAEYYSTIEFTATGAHVGKPIARHLTTLARGGWMTPAELAAVTADAAEYADQARARIFYANAWAAAHAYASEHQGRPPLLKNDYSTDAVAGYLARSRSLRGRSPEFDWVLDQGAPEVSNQERPLSESESAVMRADLLLHLGKRDEAVQLLNGVAQHSSQLSALLERSLSLIALERGNISEATRHFEGALIAADVDADTYFEYAVFLNNNTRAQRRKVAELLAKAIERNPNHAEAQFLQGRLLASEGRHDEALAYFERARAILPREALFTAAIESSREALRRNPLGPANNVRTPDSWTTGFGPVPVPGNKRLSGNLTEVECMGTAARIHVGSKVLHITNPNRVLSDASNASQTELTCGRQIPAPRVEVDYQTASDEVTRFRVLPWGPTK